MPKSPTELMEAAGITLAGSAPWGDPPQLGEPGCSIIALSPDPDTKEGRGEAPISSDQVAALLEVRPELRLDGSRPTTAELSGRISSFWLPDEPVLYVGLAGTSVAKRANDYYRTPLGARSPHSGGWFLKTLHNLHGLWVHYGSCSDPDDAEAKALRAFAVGVSESARRQLHDPERVMPFANLEYPKGARKRHGVTGAREPRGASPRSPKPPASEPRAPVRPSVPVDSVTPHLSTQRVTAADIGAGRIRIPVTTKPAVSTEKAQITVGLRGERLDCRWDPRPSRSGVIGVGRAKLAQLVSEGEVLRVDLDGDTFRLN